MAAGYADNLISHLTAMAEEIPSMAISPIHGIGDEAMWLWQHLENGHFALFISREQQQFHVVMGLLNGEAEELTVLDYAVRIARRFD